MNWETMVCYLICAVFLVSGWFIWRRRKFYQLSYKLPGPTAYPFVGNGLSFLSKSEDLLDKIIELTEPYSSPMRLWFGPQLAVVVTDPDQLQVLMQSQKLSTKSFVYTFLEPFMGKGLFTSAGIIHKNQRKLLQPFFGSKYLEGYVHLFQKHADKLVEYLRPYGNSNAFDVLNILHDSAFEATMDILVEDKNDHSIDYKRIPEFIRKFYHIFTQRVISFWMYPECLFRLTRYYKEQACMEKIIKTLTEEVKEARIPCIFEKLDCKVVNNDNKTEIRTPSILEMMVELVIDNPDCLNEKEFLDHMLTFVATSQDTQSSAIAFTLMMLGMHPHYQKMVIDELQGVLEDRPKLVFEDLSKLKFMEMCIKESMRLFPLGPFLPRDTPEGFQLGTWTIPAGTMIVLGVYQVHRNPKLWEKPNDFFPEHFNAEAVSKRHSFSFLPFSAGPRRCIAQQWSYTNMKIIISTILQNYTIDSPGTMRDLKLKTDVSIRPKGGYMICLKTKKI